MLAMQNTPLRLFALNASAELGAAYLGGFR